MTILILTLIFLLTLAKASHAGGGGGSSETYSSLAPKNERLVGLENQMYDLADGTMSAYTKPLNGIPATGAASAGTAGTAGASAATGTSAAKAGTATSGLIPQRPHSYSTDSGDPYQNAMQFAINSKGSITQNADGTYSVKYKNGGLAGKNDVERYSTRTFGTAGTANTSSASSAPAQAAPSSPVPTLSLNGLSIPQPYDSNTLMGQLFNDATKKTYVANNQYDDLVQQAPQISNQISSLLGQGVDAVNQSKTAGDWYFDQAKTGYTNAQDYLGKAGTEGDWWYDKAKGAYANAEGFIPQIQSQFDYTNEANKWYDDYTRGMLGGAKNMLDTGSIPQPIMDAMLASMTQGVNQSVGANVNDLAARGVLNSSVTNRALSDASRSVSDSMNANYLNAFSSILGGYNDTAATGANAGKAFADTNLNIISGMNDTLGNMIGLGDSYGKTGSSRVNDLLGVAQGYNANADSLMGAGSQRINDWLNIATGYNNSASGYGSLLDSNLAQREALQNDLSKYYVNAAAPMVPAYDLMKTMQQDHWNSDGQDTVVTKGK